MGDKVNVDIRPCRYLIGGEYQPGLFHRWVTLHEDYRWLRKGTFVALIELENGAMDYIKPDYICFTDTKEQMERLGLCVVMEGKE